MYEPLPPERLAQSELLTNLALVNKDRLLHNTGVQVDYGTTYEEERPLVGLP